MGDESHSWHLLATVAGQSSHKVTVLVERYVFKSHIAQLLLEMLGENHLPWSGGGEVSEFVALRVELHILEESVYYVHSLKKVDLAFSATKLLQTSAETKIKMKFFDFLALERCNNNGLFY